MDASNVPINIKFLRLGHGWSLEKLASRAGMSKTYLSRIEKGRTNPSLGKLNDLCQALGVHLSVLIEPLEGWRGIGVV